MYPQYFRTRTVPAPTSQGAQQRGDVFPVLRTGNKLDPSLRLRLFPIVFFFIFLNFTVFLFAFGPWKYPVTDGATLYVFLFCAHLALLVGYCSAVFQAPRGYAGPWRAKRLFTLVLVINLILLVPTFVFRTGSPIPNVVGGIENPGQAYAEFGFLADKGTPVVEYLRIFFGVFLFLLFPITVFYWAKLKPVFLALATLCILGMTAAFVAMGTNKGIVDLALLTPWLLFASQLAGVSRLRWHQVVVMGAGLIVVAALAFQFFTITQTSRMGSRAYAGYSFTLDSYADRSGILARKLPLEVLVGIESLSSYISQGYFGLYLSLKEPPIPMFGVGNSMFLYRQAARITGIDEIADLPYPIRIHKYGWNSYVQWSSIYPWIASDVSFPGTIVVVLIIGRLFALSWLDTLRGENPFAVAMFTQFLIMLFYFSANNQVAQSGERLVSFWGVLLLWLYTRKMVCKARSPQSFT